MKSLSSRTLRLEFWEERGEKLMTCHLFLDNFLRFYDLWVVFKGLRVFETKFSFKRTQISQFWYHEMFVISEPCLSQKTFLLQKIDCVFVLAIRGLLHVTRNFVLWCDFFCVLITVTESFWKVFLEEIMVLSKTCVRFRNRIFKRFE